MKSQRNVLEWILTDESIVEFDVIEQGFFVSKVIIMGEMVVDHGILLGKGSEYFIDFVGFECESSIFVEIFLITIVIGFIGLDILFV